MIYVNLKTGATLQFDPRDADQYELLQDALVQPITALTIKTQTHQNTVTLPKRFHGNPVFGVDLIFDKQEVLIGEQAFLQIADLRLLLTYFYNRDAIRTDLVRVGQMKYNPRRRSRR